MYRRTNRVETSRAKASRASNWCGNGTRQIIALAGDFYGVRNHPIINPSKGINQTDYDRQQRFLAAYNNLARAPKEILQKEVNQLITALDRERKTGASIANKANGTKSLVGSS